MLNKDKKKSQLGKQEHVLTAKKAWGFKPADIRGNTPTGWPPIYEL
jgi:hypothetical protein